MCRLFGLLFLLLVGDAWGQAMKTIPQEYEKLISGGTVMALGNDLLGDRVDLYSGRLSFLQTDVDIPGNNALPVGISRSFSPHQASVRDHVGHFSDWDLELPYMTGVFSASTGWVVPGTGAAANKRCSNYAAPPEVSGLNGSMGGIFSAAEYWQGNTLHLPGIGDGEVVVRNSALPAPAADWKLAVKGGIAVRCVASLASGSMGSGEGFEVLAPNGLHYRFDHLLSMPTSSLQKSDSGPLLMSNGMVGPMVATLFYLNRVRVWIFPTEVSDAHGNTLHYYWNAGAPAQLDRIQASDGRELVFTWSGGHITAISDGSRTWTYAYTQETTGLALSSVVLPDGSTWKLQLREFNNMQDVVVAGSTTCDALVLSTSSFQGSITHPSGATGTFVLSPRSHGRSWVDRECRGGEPSNPYGVGSFAYYPREFPTASLTEKRLAGPGLPTGLKWTYDYGTPNHCWSTAGNNQLASKICTASSPDTVTVRVTEPEGRVSRYVFGNRFRVNEGRLQNADVMTASGSVISATTHAYAPAATGPFPQAVGQSLQPRGDGFLQSRNEPLQTTSTVQNGISFMRKVNTYDVWARPTKVAASSGSAE